MRLVLPAGSIILAIAGLGGCGNGDEAFRATYRASAIESCMTGARAAPNAAAAGLDFQRLCGCSVDAYMAHASTEQLRRERVGTSVPAGARAAMITCLGQMRPDLVGTPPAPAGNKPS